MTNFKINDRVKINNSYEYFQRGKIGVVVREPQDNPFIKDLTVVKLLSGSQISISAQYLELLDEQPVLKEGDRVRFKETTPNSYWRGREGTVLKDADGGKVLLDILSNAHVANLELIERILKEGEEIDLKDIVAGMEIKVTHTSGTGDYTQTSTKQGVVKTIVKDGAKGANIRLYAKDGAAVRLLSFDSPTEVFTLIKNAPKPDEITEALKEAKVGSVVQIEDGGTGNFVLTYVKSDPATNGTSRWLVLDSRYTYTALTSENTLRSKMQSLDQLVHKR